MTTSRPPCPPTVSSLGALACGLLSWGLAQPAMAADAPSARPADNRFEKVVLTGAGDQPMEISVAADGRVFFVEKNGPVKVYKPDSRQTVQVALLEVYKQQKDKPGNLEEGLLGIALDPGFMKNGWIYLLYGVPEQDKSEQHLARFTLVGDQLDLSSKKILLVNKNQRRETGHCGGSLLFDKKGDLWISTGDNIFMHSSDGYTPIDEQPGAEPRDAQGTSGNCNDLSGKVLRIHPKPDGTYDIPAGNLFKPGTPGTRPEIYAMGCRNPFRISVDDVTGFLYWGDVGPDAGKDGERGPRGHDEVNQARQAGFFGWPYFIANNLQYADYDFAAKKLGALFDPKAPINDSRNNTGIKNLPPAQPAFIYYPYAESTVWPMLGGGGRTAMAGPVIRYDAKLKSEVKFPPYYDNTLIIYDWMRNWVKAVKLDDKGDIVRIEPLFAEMTFKKPMDMEFGPDGALYVLEYGSDWFNNKDAQLVRIEYAAGNRAPIAKAAASPDAGRDPLTVGFSSEGTLDKDDGDKLTYAWKFTGDKVESSEANPTYTFSKPGLYKPTLTVTDKAGKSSTTMLAVSVGNAVPTVTIEEPKAGSFYAWNSKQAYVVNVVDEEDGTSASGDIADEQVTVSAAYRPKIAAKPAVGHAAAAAGVFGSHKGLDLAAASDCFGCHTMQNVSVGPAFPAVAQKYAKVDGAKDLLARKIIDGGAGVWGETAMAAHPQHNLEQTREMAAWILTLADLPAPMQGAKGSFTTIAKPDKDDQGAYVITAKYVDIGAKGIGPMTGQASVVLRSRRVQAEDFSTSHGVQLEDTKDGGPGKNLSHIDNHDHISFKDITLAGTKKITFRVASAGSGGFIEVRVDSPTGPVIGKAEVKPTGDWQKFVDVDAAIQDPGGTHELFVVFGKDGGGGGLFNLNWLHFHEPAAP